MTSIESLSMERDCDKREHVVRSDDREHERSQAGASEPGRTA
jgi:hypothetical protein